MKTLIIALNSKYIHSSLAPWYLKAACNDMCGQVKVIEFTINENPETILAAIYAEKMQLPAVIDSLLSTISDSYGAISFLYRVYFSKK